MKISNLLLLIALCSQCGDSVLNEVNTFQPNKAPELTSIEITDVNQKPHASFKGSENILKTDTQLEPGQLYYFTLTIIEPEEELISLAYVAKSYLNLDANQLCNSDISGQTPNTTGLGAFNNQLQSTDFQREVTATATYYVPSASELPRNSDVYATVSITDSKDAVTTFTQCLGPIKRTPVMTELSYTPSDTSGLTWRGDSNGSFMLYAKSGPCTNLSGEVTYPYKEGQVLPMPTVVASPFCVVLFDSLGQFDFIEH